MTLQAFSASNSASCAFLITFVLIQLNIFECNYGLNVHHVILQQFNSAFYSVAVWLCVSVCELLSNLERKKISLERTNFIICGCFFLRNILNTSLGDFMKLM